MLSSGIPLVRAIRIMIDRCDKPKLRAIYERIYIALQQGQTLSDAMTRETRAFPELLINMIRAGEASGTLEQTTMKMAQHYDKEHRLNNKIKSATTYPIILLVLLVLVVIAIFTFVLPQFFTLFTDIELPAITKVVMAISHFVTQYWMFLLIGVLVLIAVWSAALRTEKVRLAYDRFKLRIPRIGKLLRIIYTARFSRTLSSLYSSGLTMTTALPIAAKTLGNAYIARQFHAAITRVRNGEMLSAAIESIDGFDSKLAETIYIGEETGRLDDMLNSVADSFDYDSEMATQKLVTYIEPIMIIFMAVVIGFVMVSVILPIYTLYTNIH